jgi:hypothetical protein
MMDELGLLLVPNLEHNPLYQIFEYDTTNSYGKSKHNIDYIVNQKMSYTWVNIDNPKEREVVEWSLYGVQDDISKALGSGLTYSERYFLLKFFDIPTDDEDPDTKQKKAEENVITKPVTSEPKKVEVKETPVEKIVADMPSDVVSDEPVEQDTPEQDAADANNVRYTE